MHPARTLLLFSVVFGCLPCGQTALSVDCGHHQEARESESHTITCRGLDPNKTVFWRFVPVASDTPIPEGGCTRDSCWSNDTLRYEVGRNGSTSTLHIKNVTRTGRESLGEWRCQQDGSQGECSINQIIYPARVDNNRCSIAFNESSKLVTARCEIIKSYPAATCTWNYNRENHSVRDVPTSHTLISYQNYHDSASGHIYARGECRIHAMPLPVEEGAYTFRVVINPGGTEPDVAFITTNVIEHPDVPKLQECQEDWIDLDRADNDEVICKCSAPDLGSPPGHLLLMSPDNTVLRSSPSDPVPLYIGHVSKSDSERNFSCIVRHHTGDRVVKFAPKLAYGPSRVIVSHIKEENGVLELECLVMDANPEPSIEWDVRGHTSSTKGDTVLDGSIYKQYLNIEILDYGKGVTVSCKATNPQRVSSTISASPYIISGTSSSTSGGCTGLGCNIYALLILAAICLPLRD